ncbi:beta-N-acetylglucosaminidase domain-containing protein [Dysgonomonas sp. Shenzhen-Wh21]|uniref:beta-N-acetylglucosaminidase n=1 Tax=Dysgonomonas TaxID=156973 RepID=UPI00208FA120|nr:beta-N-acetylglucosaminidase [Dysgonomonas mossii]
MFSKAILINTARLSILIFTLLLWYACMPVFSQNIHPTVQEIKLDGRLIKTPSSVQIVKDIPEADAVAAKVGTLFTNIVAHKSYPAIVGIKGDKSVKPFSKNIPLQSEGYYLSINEKRIVVAGADERGVRYGLQTLSQLLESDSIPVVEIRDWPDVAYRGVVEGFYGTPWSFEARLSQIKFYGENKLNTYIYGPKDDPYHSSPHWRYPYPDVEATAIKALVDCSNVNNVDFVWAVHPGKDIKWNQSDRDSLIVKFEKMYDLGVRSFAVFFDDISGEGTKADKQAELLNYVNRNFIKSKQDIKPLIMCPTEYNKSWSNVEKGYLPTLGKELDDDIHIMWTGDRVCTDIHRTSLEWINPLIDRPAFVWWNFPVSDYVRDHLLMGCVYGNDTDIAHLMSGFVCNPMERAEASKIAIYSVASYTWNMKKYDADKSWGEAISLLIPNNSEALKKFAKHNSDLGANGHLYRREESVHILPIINSVNNTLSQSGKIDSKNYDTLYSEFVSIVEASNILMASEDNKTLLSEIEPWVMQFKNVGETGLAVMDMYKALKENKKIRFLRKYKLTQALNKINFNIDQKYNQNPYQPGVKTASLHITPLINNIFTTIVKQYNLTYNANLEDKSSYSPFKMETSVTQLKNVLLQTKLNKVIIPPVNEIIRWKTGDYILVESNDSYLFSAIRINMEDKDPSEWTVETSQDGNQWIVYDQPIELNKQLKLTESGIKYLKLVNKGQAKEIKFNRCEIEFVH